MKCSVKDCNNQVKFKFPKNIILKRKWLEAIKRPDFIPTPKHGLCIHHFAVNDIVTESYRDGYKLERTVLKRGSLPTVFPWLLEKNDDVEDMRSEHAEGDVLSEYSEEEIIFESELQHTEHLETQASISNLVSKDSSCTAQYDCYEEEVCSEINDNDGNYENDCVNSDSSINEENSEGMKTISSQTDAVPRYNIEDFKNSPKALLHFTGMESYEKFMTVLYSLGPAVHQLKCRKGSCVKLSISNQLFMVLWKLRRYACDIELAQHFNVSETAVADIFITWIIFMSNTWSLIDVWPSRKLINFYMPDNFKKNFPNTRITLDGTEIKIEAPSNPLQKQSSFSTYKNTTTFKVMVGTTPGGLISHCSPAYGGSTSDRQIIERSQLQTKCESGDVILADKGFLVQDLFAPYNVTVATPTPLVKGSLPHNIVLKDRKLSKHRVHIERVIGLLKTFTILSKKLNRYHRPLASEIVGVCVMLTNFKENIM